MASDTLHIHMRFLAAAAAVAVADQLKVENIGPDVAMQHPSHMSATADPFWPNIKWSQRLPTTFGSKKLPGCDTAAPGTAGGFLRLQCSVNNARKR